MHQGQQEGQGGTPAGTPVNAEDTVALPRAEPTRSLHLAGLSRVAA
jgi:hypothetical protein